jgi:hypothetical protein
MHVDFDSSLAGVIDLVREVHAPIDQAMTEHKPVDVLDFAALAGAVSAMLDAIDARLAPAPEQPAKAAA